MTVIRDLSKATPDEMFELQKKELQILKYLKKICKRNNLKFFLGGGSCIGAIRHNGFIPWDDDVDVFMLRNDYEKLYANWDEYSRNSKYSLCRSDETHNYKHAAMTINDNETTFINFRTENEDVNQGIGVDIIPIDYLSDNLFLRFWQRLNAISFSIYVNQRLPDNQGQILKVLTRIPLSIVKSPHTRYKIWKFNEKQMTRYSIKKSRNAVELVTGLKAIFRSLNPEWFDATVNRKFEDTYMPVAAGFDEYLNLIFGDYMKLPKIKERKAKHHTILIDTNTSYLEYKGKYYLRKEK